MQFKSRKEIHCDLEYINRGNYGSIYRKGDRAIKIYHDSLYRYETDNPCLMFDRRKLYRLMKRNEKIRNTQLIEELVFIQDQFAGVSYPFIEGNILDGIFSLFDKKEICKQLITNARELTNHQIYPLDYKKNNILYDVHGRVQIIDLDDVLTKVTVCPNPFFLLASMYTLKNTIISFIEEDSICDSLLPLLDRYKDSIELYRKLFTSYSVMGRYVEKRCKEIETLFVSIHSHDEMQLFQFDFLKDFLQKSKAKVILTTDHEESDLKFLKDIVMYLQNYGFSIYDILPSFDSFDEQFFPYLKCQGIEHFLMYHYSYLPKGIQPYQIYEEDDALRYVKVLKSCKGLEK